MPNIRRLSNTQLTLDFYTIQSKQDAYFNQFLSSSLGSLYQAIPFKELVATFNLVEHTKGPESYFSPRGKIGLMILKHHSCLSDKDLLARLNSDFHYQFFCDIQIDPLAPLENHKLISQIRCELANNLCIDE